ncbi:MAG: hypothetical protein EBX50_18780, partial [Chitinophagia bacterium]|nr:hypothetical protein [Chitinophagia bacterium]
FEGSEYLQFNLNPLNGSSAELFVVAKFDDLAEGELMTGPIGNLGASQNYERWLKQSNGEGGKRWRVRLATLRSNRSQANYAGIGNDGFGFQVFDEREVQKWHIYGIDSSSTGGNPSLYRYFNNAGSISIGHFGEWPLSVTVSGCTSHPEANGEYFYYSIGSYPIWRKTLSDGSYFSIYYYQKWQLNAPNGGATLFETQPFNFTNDGLGATQAKVPFAQNLVWGAVNGATGDLAVSGPEGWDGQGYFSKDPYQITVSGAPSADGYDLNGIYDAAYDFQVTPYGGARAANYVKQGSNGAVQLRFNGPWMFYVNGSPVLVKTAVIPYQTNPTMIGDSSWYGT